jgi:hypothetical protein
LVDANILEKHTVFFFSPEDGLKMETAYFSETLASDESIQTAQII